MIKWIGQHIWDFVSRFRNDVYLENIADGTVASDKFLGLDSNNKIVKEAITSGGGDITGVSITTDSGSGSKASDADGSADFSLLGVGGVNVTNSDTTITVTSVPGEIDHDSLLNFDANRHFTQASITTVGTIGTGVWQGTAIASAYLDEDTSHLSVAQTFTAAKTFGISNKLEFRDSNSYIHSPTANDLKISATDILLDAAGPIYLDAGADNQITFQEAGTTIAGISAHHAATYFNMYENEGASTDDYFEIKTAAVGATTITTIDAGGTEAHLDFAVDGTFSVASTGIDIATDGTITNATWQGTAIGASYVATLNQDTTGSSASCTGQAATVATIAGLAPNTATTQATQPNITSIGTDGDTFSVLADTLRMTNTTSSTPMVNFINTTDDTSGPVITLESGRGGAAAQDGDYLGTIKFTGYDDQGTPAVQNYAQIYAQVHDATSGEESGSLSFSVANHDGGAGEVGLRLLGGSEDGEIDVTIGNGANSIVTVPGRIVDKRYRIIQASFRDDIQTTKHYVPLAGVDEQTVLTRADACAQLAVCDGRLVSASVRVENMAGSSDQFTLTMGVETNVVGSSYESTFSVTETEDITCNVVDDHHIYHFVFDTAKHWDSTDMFAVSIQSSEDHFGTNERWFVTLVVEDDWSTYLGGNREGVSSIEIDTTP